MDNREKEIVLVPLEDIIPNRFQPRLSFDEQGLNELAQSIKEHGIIQPLVLRKIGDKFEIIAGERRYKASYIAGLTEVPAVIINLNDNESAEVAIVENIQRKDLSPIEEAKSYKKLLDRGYLTQDQLAGRMGKTQATVSNKLRLLNLDEDVQAALLNNKISERHARSILRISDKEKQKNVLNQILNKRLNVRDTENLVSEVLNENKKDEFIHVSNLTPNTFEFPEITNNQIENKTEETTNLDSLLNGTISLDNISLNNDEEEEIEVMDDNNEEVLEVKADIDTAIEKVEKLVEELKELGLEVNLEKYDFDELYQFVIKVERK
ncbi:MAG: ParB/RepB/Spo0J family partition protein [Bacilli bacterium]|nr:ParB/RepB/Spo0J family partition protein [Bacilli bacterium]